MISIDNIAVEFGGRALFSDVTFNVNDKDKIALMGKNGAGKSTMLKIIAGVDKPTKGKISKPNGAVIAYLPQHLLTEDNATVFEETAKAFSSVLNMKAEIDELNLQLETRTDYESDEYMAIIERVSEVSEKYYSIEEINYDAEIEKTLLGFGNHLLLLVELLLLLFHSLFTQLQVLRIVYFIVVNTPHCYFNGTVGNIIDKSPIV